MFPTLLPDRRGYALGDEIVIGFADRPELDDATRERIARWARRFGGADDAGRSQADTVVARRPTEAEDDRLADALIADRQELRELHLSGLLDELTDEQRGWVAHPHTHPGVGDVRYPVSVGVLAAIAGVSEDQLRRWADSHLLPSFRVGVERRFGRAGAARAMVLAGASKPEKAVLSAVADGEGRRIMLLLGAVTKDALARADHMSPEARAEMASAFRSAADTLSPAPRRRGRSAAQTRAPLREGAVVLRVERRRGGWVVLDEQGEELCSALPQKAALIVARRRLQGEGGGEVHVHGRNAVRRYKVGRAPVGDVSGAIRRRTKA